MRKYDERMRIDPALTHASGDSRHSRQKISARRKTTAAFSPDGCLQVKARLVIGTHR